VIAAVTRRRSSTPAPEPVAATTSAVAALARAAVGATGRTLDSADEIVPTRGSTGFAATLARRRQRTGAAGTDLRPVRRGHRAPAATVPANRARFQIDPPHEAHHESAAPAVQPPPLPTAAVTDAQPGIAASEPAAVEAAVEASPAPCWPRHRR
jgi:flagellar biosynthesis protein FlhF